MEDKPHVGVLAITLAVKREHFLPNAPLFLLPLLFSFVASCFFCSFNNKVCITLVREHSNVDKKKKAVDDWPHATCPPLFPDRPAHKPAISSHHQGRLLKARLEPISSFGLAPIINPLEVDG